MYCNQCGAELQADYNLCPKCGTPLAGRLRSAPAQGRLSRHLHTLGILWIVCGALFLIPAIVLFLLGTVVHIAVPGTAEIVRVLGPLLFTILGAGFMIVGAGGICVGWGLMQHQPWARVVGIVLGILALFHPPLGTALGIYTLWVLAPGQSATEYTRLVSTA
jgi:hypothetical protein